MSDFFLPVGWRVWRWLGGARAPPPLHLRQGSGYLGVRFSRHHQACSSARACTGR